MSDDDFLKELGLPASYDINAVEQGFVGQVKARMQAIAETFDETELAKEEEWMRRFYAMFFQYALHWGADQTHNNKNIQDHPDAAKLKISGQEAIQSLQELIVEFACCYMHLTRFMTLLRDEIQKEEVRMHCEAGPPIRWTPDAGILRERNQKQLRTNLSSIARLHAAKDIFEETGQNLSTLRQNLDSLFGKDKGEAFTRSMTAALRTSNFKKAHSTLKNIAGTKKKFGIDQKKAEAFQKSIAQIGQKLITLVSENTKAMEGLDNKLCLRPHEADMARNSFIRDANKAKEFMTKYHIPYMQYKLDNIQLLKDKLLVIGSLESLMTLYKRLLTGIALPLADIKAVRLFEGEVLNNTTWLLQGHLQEIPKIMGWAEETVREFRTGKEEFMAIESIEMKETPVDEKKTI